jgi:L-rhamnose mutarotase
VLTVDLKDAPGVIEAYQAHHRAVWPAVVRSLKRVGVREMEIYRHGRRLVMVLDTSPGFDPGESFAAHRTSDPQCAEWEALMKDLQQPAPGTDVGDWWAPMKRLFRLTDQEDPTPVGSSSARHG